MNREIKFRGQQINTKKWVYGYLYRNKGLYVICENIRYAEEEPIFLDTVGQYTGVHDRFGNEIYDGDKVYVRSEDENAIIEWDDITARFIIHFDGWIADFDNFYGSDLEILETIYDNPELFRREE